MSTSCTPLLSTTRLQRLHSSLPDSLLPRSSTQSFQHQSYQVYGKVLGFLVQRIKPEYLLIVVTGYKNIVWGSYTKSSSVATTRDIHTKFHVRPPDGSSQLHSWWTTEGRTPTLHQLSQDLLTLKITHRQSSPILMDFQKCSTVLDASGSSDSSKLDHAHMGLRVTQVAADPLSRRIPAIPVWNPSRMSFMPQRIKLICVHMLCTQILSSLSVKYH